MVHHGRHGGSGGPAVAQQLLTWSMAAAVAVGVVVTALSCGAPARGTPPPESAHFVRTPPGPAAARTLDLWEYRPLDPAAPGAPPGLAPFIGADELHMTHFHCVGALTADKTCVFRNLYFNGHTTQPGRRSHFVMFHPISEGQDPARVKAQLLADAAVILPSVNIWGHGDRNDWVLSAVLFERVRKVGSVPAPAEDEEALWAEVRDAAGAPAAAAAPAAGDAQAQPPPEPWPAGVRRPRLSLVVPELLRTEAADFMTLPSAGGRDGDAARLAHACRLSQQAAAAAALGMACAPPGVSATVTRPLFIMVVSVRFNIAHWLWDDVVAWFGAVRDLGLGGRHNDMQLLTCYGSHEIPPDGWEATNPLVVQTFPGVSHDFRPATCNAFHKAAAGRVVHVRTVFAGLMKRAAHTMHLNYTAYGVPSSRLVWDFRQHYLRGFNLSDGDAAAPGAAAAAAAAAPPPATVQPGPGPAGAPPAAARVVRRPSGPVRVAIVQKQDKRTIVDLDSLVARLKGQFPAAEFSVVRWEALGGHVNEIKQLLATDVMLSADGTGADTSFLMPPGSVHLSLGLATPWGSGNMADNIFASYDHVRVLYYEGLPCEPGAGMQSVTQLRISAESLFPFVAHTIKLVQEGFEVPVPFLANHSPNGRLCYRVFHYYPQVAAVAGRMWLDGIVCDRLRNMAGEMYEKYVCGYACGPPESLAAVVEGSTGWPPGPDINEVTGKPPQPCGAAG